MIIGNCGLRTPAIRRNAVIIDILREGKKEGKKKKEKVALGRSADAALRLLQTQTGPFNTGNDRRLIIQFIYVRIVKICLRKKLRNRRHRIFRCL